MISKVSPPEPPLLKPHNDRVLCSKHYTDISIKPCDDCLKLLDKLLKKYNILSDIEV
jgi:hypothetical protein